jgi:hypothetical protein
MLCGEGEGSNQGRRALPREVVAPFWVLSQTPVNGVLKVLQHAVPISGHAVKQKPDALISTLALGSPHSPERKKQCCHSVENCQKL